MLTPENAQAVYASFGLAVQLMEQSLPGLRPLCTYEEYRRRTKWGRWPLLEEKE